MTMARLVDAPALRINPHGLVESGNLVDDPSGRWEAGVTFTPDGCHIVNATEVACPPEDKAPPQDCVAFAAFKPYVLEMAFAWSTADRGYDVKDRAVTHMKAGSSARLEALISAAASSPSLEDGVLVTGNADARLAVGYLEAALLDADDHTGGGGTLYMNPVHAMVLNDNVVEIDGSLYTCSCMNQVIVGNFPVGTIYGHIGQVDVYLGDIFINEFPDTSRTQNEEVIQAERLAMAVWNPCALYQAPVA